jgi:hypothetical protein
MGKAYYLKSNALQKLSEEGHMRNVKSMVSFILFFSLILLTTIHAGASDGTTVSCYIANPPDYEYVGELESFNLAEATNNCNKVYYNCKGECVGCYLNAESFEICIDKNGNQFERE